MERFRLSKYMILFCGVFRPKPQTWTEQKWLSTHLATFKSSFDAIEVSFALIYSCVGKLL